MIYDNFKYLIIYGFFFFLVIGCARQMNPDIERGSDINLQDAYTGVRLSSHGFLNLYDEPVLEVTTEISYSTLEFQSKNDESKIKKAHINIGIRLLNRKTGETINANQDFEIESGLNSFVISHEVFRYTEEFNVDPGDHNIAVSVLDMQSGLEIISQTEANVPDFDSNRTEFTAIQLSGKGEHFTSDSGYSSLTEYNISSTLDSLKFSFQVSNMNTHEPLDIQSRLIRFDADLDRSASMSASNPSSSQIEYKGVNYRDYTVLDERVRTLEQPGHVLIEFKYELPSKGNYRFEMKIKDQDGNNHFRARDFAIRSENFPAIISSREFAEPLAYLMSNDEYDLLMSLEDPVEIKEKIDYFWLSNAGSMSRAREALKMYYKRVEEANKLFTNFKEGWKTDRGKIYILFGPPWYVDRRSNELVWSYTHNVEDPEYNYTFKRNRVPNEYFPFDHYLLQRQIAYHRLEHRQRQLWRTGSIIDRRR